MGYMDNWSPYDELYGDTDTERYNTDYLLEDDRDYYDDIEERID